MRIFLFILGILFIHSTGIEYGISSRSADAITNVVLLFFMIALVFAFHWLVANGLNKRKVKFFTKEYWSLFPLTIVVLIVSIIYGRITGGS